MQNYIPYSQTPYIQLYSYRNTMGLKTGSYQTIK